MLDSVGLAKWILIRTRKRLGQTFKGEYTVEMKESGSKEELEAIETSTLSRHGMGRSLLLAAAALLLPLLLMLVQSELERQEETQQLQQRLIMLQWVTPIYEGIDLATRYRGLREIAHHNPNHPQLETEDLAQIRLQFTQQLQRFQRLLQQLPSGQPHLQKALEQTLERVAALWKQEGEESSGFITMSDLIDHLNSLLLQIHHGPVGLSRILLIDIPELREVLAQLRGTGSSLLARNHNHPQRHPLPPDDLFYRLLQQNLWVSNVEFTRLRNTLSKQQQPLDSRTLSLMIEVVTEIQEIRDLTIWELIDATTISYDPIDYFHQGSDPIELLHLLAKRIEAQLKTELQQEIDDHHRQTLWQWLLIITAITFAMVVAYRNTRHLVSGVNEAIQLLLRMGSGDLLQPVRINGRKGEIGILLVAIGESQRRLHDLYREIESARQFSTSLTSSMEDGVFAVDPNDSLVFMNRAAEGILGWSQQELSDKPLMEQLCISCSGTENDLLPEERSWFRHRDGHSIPVELTQASLRSREGQRLGGTVTVFRDITQRLEMEQLLQEALTDAQQASEAKDEFLASMSHELRTPMTVIISNCEFLEEQIHTPEQQEQIRAIGSASRRLLALINDILDLSKVESGKFTIDDSPFDLAQLLHEIEQMFSQRMEQAQLTFTTELQLSLKQKLLGDVQRLGQILINLIGNALKFTPQQGAIRLTVSQQQEKLQFVVEDSGIGMSAEVLQRLFQRFEQADSSISRRFGGSGLGLYISFHLAQMMGGTITVESEEGKGSLFTLTLPLRLSDEPLITTPHAHSTAHHTLQQQLEGDVLIAEDTPELQLLERRLLEQAGVRVTIANNGEEAVTQAATGLFDLILMDMQMPVMDGIEATRQIRASGNTTPIVALTANVMQRHRDTFQQAGCNDFLGKPIKRDDLTRILQHYLPRKETLSQPLDDEDILLIDEPEESVVDRLIDEVLTPE